MGRNLSGVSQHTINYGASKDLILVHTVQLRLMIITHSSGKMVSSGISDVVIASVHSEKNCRLKKLMMMMMNIIMNKSQETMIIRGCHKRFCHEPEARKVMVHFKFDALYR